MYKNNNNMRDLKKRALQLAKSRNIEEEALKKATDKIVERRGAILENAETQIDKYKKEIEELNAKIVALEEAYTKAIETNDEDTYNELSNLSNGYKITTGSCVGAWTVPSYATSFTYSN